MKHSTRRKRSRRSRTKRMRGRGSAPSKPAPQRPTIVREETAVMLPKLGPPQGEKKFYNPKP
jgi:hypothetical protein